MESSNSLARAQAAISQSENIFNQRTQALKTQDILKEQLEEQKDEEVNKSIEGITDNLGGQLEAKGIDVGKRALSFAKNKLLGKAESLAFRKGQSTAGRFLQDARTKGFGSATKNLGGDFLERGQRQALRMLGGQNEQIANVMSGESDLGTGLNDAMNSWSLDALDGDIASNVTSTVSDAASNVASNVASTVSDAASNVASTVSDAASGVASRASVPFPGAATKVTDRIDRLRKSLSDVGESARSDASDAANSIKSSITSIAEESNGKISGIAKAVSQDVSHPFSSLNPSEDIQSAISAPVKNPSLDSAAKNLHNVVKGDVSKVAKNSGSDVESAVGKVKGVERDFMNENWVDNTKLKDMDFSLEKYKYRPATQMNPENITGDDYNVKLDPLNLFQDPNKTDAQFIGEQLERDVDAEDASEAARGAADAAAETAGGLDDTELARTGMKKIVGDAASRATQLSGDQAGSLSQDAAKSAQDAAKSAEQTLTNKVGDMGVESASSASQSAEMSAQSAAESQELAGRVAGQMANKAGDTALDSASKSSSDALKAAQSAQDTLANTVGDTALDSATKSSQIAEQAAAAASRASEQVTSDVNDAGQTASDVASKAVSDATEAAKSASNVADATSLTSDLDDVVSGASDAAKTATEAASGGVEAIEGSVEGGLVAADAVDQEIPGLDVITDAATAGLGLAMMLGGNLFKSHANATAQAAANKAQEAGAAIENLPGVGIEFGNK